MTVGRAPFARLPVLSAVVALTAVLLATAGQYGYHRDELYFRLLPPAWGYVDQPPLTPLVVHAIAGVADSVVAIRLPAIALAAASVLVVALTTAEVGGGRSAQGLATWGYAFGTFTLVAGHVFLTASWDLLVWPAVLLAVVRARLRGDPRWWAVAGAIAGASLANKLLVLVLLAAVVVALVVVGPRGGLLNRWSVGAGAMVVALGAPTLVYQALDGLPQVRMGAALAAHHGGDVRPEVVPLLLLWIGVPLSVVWVVGLVDLWRRAEWRPIRFLPVAFALVVGAVIVMGTQPYYPYGILASVFAIGCASCLRRAGRMRRRLLIAAVVVNAAVTAPISLPVVPLQVLGSTPIPAIDQAARDSVGWPTYAAEIAAVAARAGPRAVVLAGNYGEAGALNRYEPALRVVSGQNALTTLGGPPAGTRTVVAVNGQWLQAYFASCRVRARLDDRLGVQNEEQGVPVSICTGPRVPTAVWWRAAAHLD